MPFAFRHAEKRCGILHSKNRAALTQPVMQRYNMNKNKQRFKFVIPIAILAAGLLITGLIWNYSFRSIGRYEYACVSRTDDWKSLSREEKIKLLQIPEGTLARMTDKALIHAVAEYPLLADLYRFGADQEGVGRFAEECSALAELLSRATAKDSLLTDGVGLMEELRQENEDSFAAEALQDIILALYAYEEQEK